jgi:hypothetical protein
MSTRRDQRQIVAKFYEVTERRSRGCTFDISWVSIGLGKVTMTWAATGQTLGFAYKHGGDDVHVPVLHSDRVTVVCLCVPKATGRRTHARAALLHDHARGHVLVVAVDRNQLHHQRLYYAVRPLLG